MAGDDRVHVDVVATLVTDPELRLLLIFGEEWGSFNLPMSRRRRGGEAGEPPPRAALRVAAEALGVPVRLAESGRRRIPVRLESGRELVDKIYHYTVFHVEPHPDYVGRLDVRRPHLWLSPHQILSGGYEPISESARFLLRSTLGAFAIPTRVQPTSVLVVRRDHPERGPQTLLRWDPDWGYALPARRRGPAVSASAAAEQVAREELGLEPGADVAIAPARRPEFTTHGVSPTKEAPAFRAETDYRHSLFDARLRHPEAIRSDRALAWVTEEEIHHRLTAGTDGVPGCPADHPGRISNTAYEILLHLGLVAEDADPEADRLAESWLRAHGGGHG